VNDEALASSPFATTWDRYTGAETGSPRPVEKGERQTLEAMLTTSVVREQRLRAAAELERAFADQR
jgi:hypothetical protein